MQCVFELVGMLLAHFVQVIVVTKATWPASWENEA